MKELALLLTLAAGLSAQDWPTYNGDYSGRRYVELDQINSGNIDRLKRIPRYTLCGLVIPFDNAGSARGAQ